MSFCLPQLVTVFLSPSTSLCLSVNDFLSVASFLCPSGSVCLTPSTSLCLFVSVALAFNKVRDIKQLKILIS